MPSGVAASFSFQLVFSPPEPRPSVERRSTSFGVDLIGRWRRCVPGSRRDFLSWRRAADLRFDKAAAAAAAAACARSRNLTFSFWEKEKKNVRVQLSVLV